MAAARNQRAGPPPRQHRDRENERDAHAAVPEPVDGSAEDSIAYRGPWGSNLSTSRSSTGRYPRRRYRALLVGFARSVNRTRYAAPAPSAARLTAAVTAPP